ncbi:DUF1622 domain-containing protein (plasmid) [Acaryochloris sp. 'Moss Beach']|uniref:DUF1622 domain-containing protein n=1 Tax=Acaryochloris TaxID=155977 RepID=UPI001BAEEFF7|nr:MULTISPECIES: DUF1622 domain-containing protein [Acaryochloris]QUY40331.1 DUF1622 domain-containing protein [Acaryochloris marina S15]UJB72254.1 DUF1622 domain-containing protein [Acaryochloris sp. 'Moss Beach']
MESVNSFADGLAVLVLLLNTILISLCQLLALFVVFVGICKGLFIFLKNSLLQPHTPIAFQRSRLEMGYAFSLGLSFLIGATILNTMFSKQLEDIGRLILIIGLRTLLNLLLERAINHIPQAKKEGNYDTIGANINNYSSQQPIVQLDQ